MPTLTPPEKLKQSRTQVTVTFAPDEVAKAEAKALEELGGSIRIEGFRPGRAPAHMLREKIDPTALSEETIRTLLPAVFTSLSKEHTLAPIIPPNVELKSRDPMTLTLTFIERPEVKVKGAEKISVKKEASKIAEKDVDRMIDYLRGQYRSTKPVDREAKEGDELVIDFVGMDGGKEVEGTRASAFRLTLGSKSLIPGFEDAMLGARKDETKTFTVTFPADYHAEHLRGKPVAFTATVHAIEEVALPELTDAFVKEHHLGESAAELRGRVLQSLKDQEAQTERTRVEKELFTAIRAATVIDLAPELIVHEERMIFDEIARNIEKDKTTMEEWLKQTNRTVEKLQKELKEEAGKRLTLRFAIQWLLDERKIDVTPDEITSAIGEVLATVPEAERSRAEAFYKEGAEGYEELKWRKRVEKLVEGMIAQ